MENDNKGIEQQKIENQENQYNYNIKELLKLLNELTKLNAQKTTVSAAIAGKNIKNTINTKVESIKTWIKSEERKYGVNTPMANNIIEKYENTLEEIKEIYDEQKKISMERSSSYNDMLTKEIVAISDYKDSKRNNSNLIKRLKKEIEEIKCDDAYKQYEKIILGTQSDLQKAVKDGDTDKIEKLNIKLMQIKSKQNNLFGDKKDRLNIAQNKVAEMTEQIKLAKLNVKETWKNMKEETVYLKSIAETGIKAMNIAKSEESTKLAILKRYNTFMKIFNSITNKINGTKKFGEKVMKPINAELKTIREEKLPEFRKKMLLKREERELKYRKFVNDTKSKFKGVLAQNVNEVARILENKIKNTKGEVAEKTAPIPRELLGRE